MSNCLAPETSGSKLPVADPKTTSLISSSLVSSLSALLAILVVVVVDDVVIADTGLIFAVLSYTDAVNVIRVKNSTLFSSGK